LVSTSTEKKIANLTADRPGSVVDIATGYGMEGLGIESYRVN